MEEGRFERALPLLRTVEKEYPENLSVLWNLGVVLAELKKHEEALATWKRYKSLAAKEFPVYPKIVQALQALEKTTELDEALKEVHTARESLPLAEKTKIVRLCREQMTVGGKQVFAFEYFDPKSPRRVYYAFSVLKADGTEDFRYSLGSYDDTTKIAEELGQIKAGSRYYHLDEYRGRSHRTFGFYTTIPPYATVRATVVGILEGKQ